MTLIELIRKYGDERLADGQPTYDDAESGPESEAVLAEIVKSLPPEPKSLYDKDFRYTTAAVNLDQSVAGTLKVLFKEYRAKGYSPREIGHVLHSAVDEAELDEVI